ncbi:MAG: tRNA 2-thiouridine(34) synthase MnmA [Lachnospiraceae bacterium]|nr:tRNA 2-thiouridine(34) synthase MnmA [Lachnospiraceae bacterium]
MSKALIAMSGGVDSSMAAALMQEAGYECIGVTMHLYDHPEAETISAKSCCSKKETEDACAICEKLGMEYRVVDFTREFRCKVMAQFVDAYVQGQTPNPCIECNKHLKFDHLYQTAKELGCDKIATGHYARVRQNMQNGRFELLRGTDPTKDQSYVLYGLTQEQLSHTLFPLGELSKSRVRELAGERGFVNAHKADSQDICFVPDGHYERFIEQFLGKKLPEGNFVTKDGQILGRHKGLIYYTVGQRKGLGIAAQYPLYVKELRPETNEVVLCEHEELFSDTLIAKHFNWGSIAQPKEQIRAQAKVRYRHTAQPCSAQVLEDGSVRVTFDEPQRAITKGQSVVLYDGDLVLGGGVITDVPE